MPNEPPAPLPNPLPVYGERGATAAPPLSLARSLLILGAAAAGVAAIDGPEPGVAFAASCRAAKADGFRGKIAVDAAQVAAINAIFADPG